MNLQNRHSNEKISLRSGQRTITEAILNANIRFNSSETQILPRSVKPKSLFELMAMRVVL